MSAASSELERAIVLAVLRGHQTPKQAARFLNVAEAVVRSTSKQMECFVVDAKNGKLWLK